MPRSSDRSGYSPWAMVAARAQAAPADTPDTTPASGIGRGRTAGTERDTRAGERRRPRRRRAPRAAGGEAGPGHERWLVSYADFITLLFAVFATMYALSAVDAGKYAALAGSMQTAFRVVNDGAGTGERELVARPADAKVGFMPAAGRVVGVDVLKQALQARLAPALSSRLVSLEDDPRGLVVSLREAGTFAVSSADLSEAARVVLGEFGTAMAELGNRIQIEGHTDDVPIHTARYASNWELSTARATAVVRFLIDASGLDPRRLSAAGYAEHFPREPNTGPEARARNRRVDIIILTAGTGPPARETAAGQSGTTP